MWPGFIAASRCLRLLGGNPREVRAWILDDHAPPAELDRPRLLITLESVKQAPAEAAAGRKLRGAIRDLTQLDRFDFRFGHKPLFGPNHVRESIPELPGTASGSLVFGGVFPADPSAVPKLPSAWGLSQLSQGPRDQPFGRPLENPHKVADPSLEESRASLLL